MTTLITGAGLIGALTAGLLAARGDRVVVLDVRRHQGDLAPGADFETCDVTDGAAVDAVVARRGITRIVHTAALLSTGIRADPVAGVRVNMVGTANVLEAARQHGVKRLVFASSTTAAYTTFGDAHPDGVAEDVPMRLISQRPASIYALTKVAGEHLVHLYCDHYGLDALSLRYGAVLGSVGGPPSSVPGRLLARLAEAGRSGTHLVLDDPFLLWGGREEFVDARDCARANIAALDASSPAQRVYNVATGRWYALNEFVAVMQQVFPGLSVDYPRELATGFAGFPHRRPAPSSIVAAERELGFTCRYSLEDTVRYWAVS